MNKIVMYICVLVISAGFLFSAVSAEAGEVRGVGYWKIHYEEREPIIESAAAVSSVFVNGQDLRYYLNKLGRKTMEEKTKREFAALLLNVAAGLDPGTYLPDGAGEIIQIFATYNSGTTVGEAIMQIEDAILFSHDLEDARELAEAINNSQLFF